MLHFRWNRNWVGCDFSFYICKCKTYRNVFTHTQHYHIRIRSLHISDLDLILYRHCNFLIVCQMVVKNSHTLKRFDKLVHVHEKKHRHTIHVRFTYTSNHTVFRATSRGLLKCILADLLFVVFRFAKNHHKMEFRLVHALKCKTEMSIFIEAYVELLSSRHTATLTVTHVKWTEYIRLCGKSWAAMTAGVVVLFVIVVLVYRAVVRRGWGWEHTNVNSKGAD